MEYTEQQKAAIMQQFGSRKTKQVIATIPFVALLVTVFGFSDQETGLLFGVSAAVWLPIALVAIGAMVAFSFTNWRCPACTRYLGKGFSPKYCPKCGVQLAP